MEKHSPTPWSYSANLSGSENHKGFSLKGFSLRARTLRIGELFPLDEVGDEGSRNAAFICKAVNCHEELVKAVVEMHNILYTTGKYSERCEELSELIAKASEGK